LPQVLESWGQYAEGHSSPSLRQTTHDSILEVRGEATLIVRTGSQTGTGRIVAENNLIEGIRSMVRRADLTIQREVAPELDRSNEVLKPRKRLSVCEALRMLTTKDPLIQQLRQRLELIPVQDG